MTNEIKFTNEQVEIIAGSELHPDVRKKVSSWQLQGYKLIPYHRNGKPAKNIKCLLLGIQTGV